jgi:hypothetical protein
VVVRRPGQADPTVGIEAHAAESIAFWKTFPDQRLDNRPYRMFFASGDWTCSIARFRGTMKGPMVVSGREIPPIGSRSRWTSHDRKVARGADPRG